MIMLLIKGYLSLFLSVAAGCVTVFLLGLFLIIKTSFKDKSPKVMAKVLQPPSTDPLSNDITAIAGEDVVGTQLDLARAYIEINQKSLAQSILEAVLEQGNNLQQEEARHLLSYIQS